MISGPKFPIQTEQRLIRVCICDWIVIGCGTESVGWLFGIRNFTESDSQKSCSPKASLNCVPPSDGTFQFKEIDESPQSLAVKDGYFRWDRRAGKLQRISSSVTVGSTFPSHRERDSPRGALEGLKEEYLRCLTRN